MPTLETTIIIIINRIRYRLRLRLRYKLRLRLIRKGRNRIDWKDWNKYQRNSGRVRRCHWSKEARRFRKESTMGKIINNGIWIE